MIIVLILKIYFLLSFTIVKYTPSCLKHLIFVLHDQNLCLYLRTRRVWWPAVIRNKPFPGSDPGDGEWSSLTMYVRTLRRMSWTPWMKTDEWVARWRQNYYFIPISMDLYQVDPCPWRSHEQPLVCRLNIKNSTTTTIYLMWLQTGLPVICIADSGKQGHGTRSSGEIGQKSVA